MNDKELLELAAKAAGIVALRWGIDKPERQMSGEGQFIGATWNPLADDGDALRLAVKLRMVVHVWDDGENVSAAKTLPDGDDPPVSDSSAWHSADAHGSGGLEAATRLAIVRAAAEIGKAMP